MNHSTSIFILSALLAVAPAALAEGHDTHPHGSGDDGVAAAVAGHAEEFEAATGAGHEAATGAGHEAAAGEHGEGGHGEGHGQRTISEINWFRWSKGENPPFAAVILNFLVLAAILYFGARKSVSAYLQERRDRIMSSIDDATKLRAQAQDSHKEFSGRLEKMKDEEQTIRQELLSSALREQERLVADAGARAEKMRVEARKLVDQERLDAAETLRRETAAQAVEVAREILSRKIGPGEQKRLVDQYLAMLQDRVNA